MQLASFAGSSYVSLFYNRLIDYGGNPSKTLRQTSDFIKQNNLTTEIIAGSIRKKEDISNAWDSGADIVTCSTEIIESCFIHPKTTESIEGFMKDFSAWSSDE